jgi:hypothetical protein
MKRTLILTAGLLAFGLTASAQTAPPQPANDEKPVATQATTRSQAKVSAGPNFVDADGDGICDNRQARGNRKGQRRGPGDGTGNRGVGPRDGSGYGAGPGANCDGTGPKGRGRRGGR